MLYIHVLQHIFYFLTHINLGLTSAKMFLPYDGNAIRNTAIRIHVAYKFNFVLKIPFNRTVTRTKLRIKKIYV